MKQRLSLCVFFSIAFFSKILAQQDFVPIQEMLSNFQTPKVLQLSQNFIEGFNTDELAIITTTDLLPLNKLTKNRNFGDMKWSLQYIPSTENPYKQILTLVQVKEENGIDVIEELSQKYGRNSIGVPATWYSGKINILLCPRNLFGEIVSKEKVVLTVSKGIIVSQTNVPLKKGSMENLPKNGVLTLDGCWHSTVQYDNLKPLEDFVNRNKAKFPIKQYSLSLLLVTNEKGKMSGYILSPARTKKLKEKQLENELLTSISELPLWSFGWLETIEGRTFTGRYLKAVYSQKDGWSFKDYLQ